MKEPLLEPYFRKLRFSRIFPYLKTKKNFNYLDVGCGFHAFLVKEVSKSAKISCGIDKKIEDSEFSNIILKKHDLTKKLPFENNFFDIITMLAVIEHVEKPVFLLSEIYDKLKKDGILIMTAPSVLAKPVLEFLSFKLGIVSKEEISDHKRYFNKTKFLKLVGKTDFVFEKHEYFSFYMNNLCILRKV
jgi:SAM-dependent methyltransferase